MSNAFEITQDGGSASSEASMTGRAYSIPTATQAEMEAGSVSDLRMMSPQSVRQAIAAQADRKGLAVAMSIVFGG